MPLKKRNKKDIIPTDPSPDPAIQVDRRKKGFIGSKILSCNAVLIGHKRVLVYYMIHTREVKFGECY